MDQPRLFHDDEMDVIRTCIAAAGGNKVVAHALWPTLKINTAVSRLSACLDGDRNEKLTFAEIIAIGKLAKTARCHALMEYLGDELRYEVTSVTKEQKLAKALARFEAIAPAFMEAAQAVQALRDEE